MTPNNPAGLRLEPEAFFQDAAQVSKIGLFLPGDSVFDILRLLPERLEAMVASRSESEEPQVREELLAFTLPFGERTERGVYVVRPLWTGDRPVWIPEASVWIAPRVRLEPTAIIKGPAVIEEGCDIRQGAYLRGSTYIGSSCVVGHTTEVKNAIFLPHAEAGHFAYIGDSILGAHTNLGAGTKLANLQLRTEEEKRTGEIRSVRLVVGDDVIDTGLVKLGAIIGDHGELGCNTVTSPGTLLGPGSWVYPTLSVHKGFYPARSLLKPTGPGYQVFERRM